MIRPLRQRHRVAVLALSVCLPAGFGFGLAMRKPVPIILASPLIAAATAKSNYAERWKKEDLWPGQKIRTRLLREGSTGGPLAFELSIHEEIVQPDLLVYWVPAGGQIADKLPGSAVLLGPLMWGSAIVLPSDIAGQEGALLLYSLANHEIVSASKNFVAK